MNPLSGHFSKSTAFTLPQWGGIYILNVPSSDSPASLSSHDLAPAFSTFSRHLSGLLGVPKIPPDVQVRSLLRSANSSSSKTLSPFQTDTLLRSRASQNMRATIDTLTSTSHLVDALVDMPVGRRVRDAIEEALDSVDGVSLPLRILQFLPLIHERSHTINRLSPPLRPPTSRCRILLAPSLHPRAHSLTLLCSLCCTFPRNTSTRYTRHCLQQRLYPL